MAKSGARNLIVGTVWLAIALSVGLAIKFFVFPAQKKETIDATSSSSQYRYEVALGIDSFSGYAILRSDAMQTECKTKGIRLALEDDGADYLKRLKSLRDGDLDMAVFTIDALVSNSISLGNIPAVIVCIIDETVGADAIVAWRDSVPSLNSLDSDNAKIVLTGASPSEFLSRVAVANFNLPNLPKDWIQEANGPKDVYKKMKGAKGDTTAFALWEPYVSQATSNPDIHILIDSSNIRGYIVDVLVARRQFIRDRPDLVGQIVEAYLRTAYIYNGNDVMATLVFEDAKKQGESLTRDQSDKIVQGIQWKNTLENYAHFGLLNRKDSGGLLHLEDMISNIVTVFVKTGAISTNNPVTGRENTLYYDQILKDLQESEFHPSKRLNIVQGGGTLGDLVKSPSLGAVRSVAKLEALSSDQWDKLLAVGNLRVQPIAFARSRATLHVQSQRELKLLSTSLKNFPRYYLQIVGHSIADGDIEENISLAQSRAESAMKYLSDLGIDEARMRAIAAQPSNSKGSSSVSFVVGQQAY